MFNEKFDNAPVSIFRCEDECRFIGRTWKHDFNIREICWGCVQPNFSWTSAPDLRSKLTMSKFPLSAATIRGVWPEEPVMVVLIFEDWQTNCLPFTFTSAPCRTRISTMSHIPLSTARMSAVSLAKPEMGSQYQKYVLKKCPTGFGIHISTGLDEDIDDAQVILEPRCKYECRLARGTCNGSVNIWRLWWTYFAPNFMFTSDPCSTRSLTIPQYPFFAATISAVSSAGPKMVVSIFGKSVENMCDRILRSHQPQH